MQVKCPVILTCLLDVVIVADKLTWDTCGKRSCCMGKNLLHGLEGSAKGCFGLTGPSDS